MRPDATHLSVDRLAARRVITAFAATLLLFGPAMDDARAQLQPRTPLEPAPETPSTFAETVDVRVVNVDVRVTDRDGNPVTGLAAEDFEVRENGRPVELSNFFEFTDGLDASTRQRPRRDSRGGARRPEDLDRFIPAEPPPPEHRLSLMVYIDNVNLTPTDRNRLLPFLRNFLSVQLSPYDRVMLAVFDRGRFKVELPFTTEAWRAAEATRELEKLVGSRERTESERLDILREIDDDLANHVAVMGLVRNFAATVRSEVDASIANLRNAIRTMAGLPGRKSILYISNGLPMRPAEDLFRAVEERFDDSRGRWRAVSGSLVNPRSVDAANVSLEAFDYDLSRRFDELAALANANRVTFHAVSAAGASLGGMNAADLRFSSSIEFTRANNLEEPLLRLADRTGGRAIVNTRNVAGAFDRIAGDFQNRYSLGYSPAHVERGRTHRIEVALTDEARERVSGRLSIRHRDSYVDKPISTEMADLTLAALAMGEAANSMGLRIAPVRGPGSEIRRESGDVQSRLLVAIPIGALTLAPAAEGREARVRLWVQVIDEEGRVSEVTEHSVPVVVKEGEIEEARKLSWPFAIDVVTAPGPHRVAVGVRDDLAATTSVATFDIDAGNAPDPPVAADAMAAAPRESGSAAPHTRPADTAAAGQPLPDTPERWLAEAAAHYRRSELDAMADAARRALEMTADIRLRARAWNALGVALFDRPDRTEQDVREAEEAFRRVIAVMDDEASAAPRYSLARVLVESGRSEQGVAEARTVLAISPEGPIRDRARILVCHSRASAAGTIDRTNEGREPGAIIYQAAHEYTEEARAAGTEGTVALRALIDDEGCVVRVDVLEGLPHGLAESAVAAMRRAVFRPAMENGEPAASSYEAASRFTGNGDD